MRKIYHDGRIRNLNIRETLNSLATGTSYKGEMEITYRRLVKAFGKPTITGSMDNKIEAEWVLLTPEGIATIYNWKDGKNYLGEEGHEVKDILDWHIGGHNKGVVGYVRKALGI